MKQILITISPTGKTNVETRGFAGEECRAASKPLEQALGLTVHEQLMPEFHQTAQQHDTPLVQIPPA